MVNPTNGDVGVSSSSNVISNPPPAFSEGNDAENLNHVNICTVAVPAVVKNPQLTSAVNYNNVVEKDTINSVYINNPTRAHYTDGPLEVESGGKNDDENRIPINSRTNYVHFELLFSKSFQDLKIVFETFLHKYSLSSVCFVADQELSFQKLRRLNTESPPLTFYQSRYAKELKERFGVTFLLHVSYHAFFTGKVERMIRVVKRSFACFSQ